MQGAVAMQAELERYFTVLGLMILGGIGLFLLRMILSLLLRKRLTKGLVPELQDLAQPDSNSRFVALIGQGAPVRETLGTTRLRATLGLKLVYWGVALMTVWLLHTLETAGSGIELVLLAVVAYLAVHTTIYEITYDRETISLPRWWMGSTTHRWRDLDAAVDRGGWYVDFHFHDGTVIQAHKYVVGYANLREAARKAMRET
jgi:hypothetical protein